MITRRRLLATTLAAAAIVPRASLGQARRQQDEAEGFGASAGARDSYRRYADTEPGIDGIGG